MTHETKSDQELVEAIRHDDRAALGILYNRYYKKVYSKCFSFTHDEATAFDLAQESLLKAFDNIPTFRGQSEFSTWLYTITHRHCLAAIKKNGRYRTHTLDTTDPVQKFDVAEDQDRDEKELIMNALINALPEKEKTLVYAKYLRGDSIENLQEDLQLSASAVKMRLKRTREKLNVLYGLAMTYGLEQVLSQIELFTTA